jgi:hypothetical protein
MYATWPIVVSALAAGLIGGFLIPDRPQSRPAVAAKAPAVPEHGKSDAVTSPRRANGSAPRVNHALADTEGGPSATSTRHAIDPQRSPCAIDSWPYRAPGCLDRTAAIEPEYSIVDVKRVDPAQSLVAEGTAGERAAKSRQKVVSAPSARSEEAGDTKREDDAPNEANGAAKTESRPQARPERRARPAGRGSAENHYGREDPRVVIRGPDGRLYLAPRYRHVPPPGYYIR